MSYDYILHCDGRGCDETFAVKNAKKRTVSAMRQLAKQLAGWSHSYEGRSEDFCPKCKDRQ